MKNFIQKITFIILFFHIVNLQATLGVSNAQNLAIGFRVMEVLLQPAP